MKADVAVVSQNFWRNRLGSDPNVVGRSITLNGVATTIVGVIPNMPIIWWGPNAEVWSTMPFDLPGLARDRLMREFCARYPEYCFSQHKGYATELHVAKLHAHGPCPIHRRSFEPVAQPVFGFAQNPLSACGGEATPAAAQLN